MIPNSSTCYYHYHLFQLFLSLPRHHCSRSRCTNRWNQTADLSIARDWPWQSLSGRWRVNCYLYLKVGWNLKDIEGIGGWTCGWIKIVHLMFFHANRWEFEHENEPLELGLRSYSFGPFLVLLGEAQQENGDVSSLGRLNSLGPVSWVLSSISVRTSNTSQVNIVLDKAWKFHKYGLSCRYSLKVHRYDLSCSHFFFFERLASRPASQPRCFQLEPAACRRFHDTWNSR